MALPSGMVTSSVASPRRVTVPLASMAAIAAAMLAYCLPSTLATACVDSLECSAIAPFASASVSPVALTVVVSSLLVADSSFAAVVSFCWVASCEAFASSSAYAVKGTLSEAAIASATAVESVLFFADAFAM